MGLLTAVSLFAQSPPTGFPESRPKTLELEYSPIADPENNARLWWSFNQVFGWGSLHLGEAGADRHWSGRLGQFIGLAYLNLAVGHYTHELGHNIHRRGWSIDFTEWGSPWPWPRFTHGRTSVVRSDNWMFTLQGGLNQEEYNAYHAFKASAGSMSFDESMAFSFRKLSGITYDVYTGRVFGYRPNPWSKGDVGNYASLLRTRGIDLSDGEFYLQAAVSDLLTFRLYEAWIGNWRYLRHGQRERSDFAWRPGGWTLIPPLVNWYLTPRGGFYDIALLSDPPGPGFLETRIGWDSDFLGGGDVDRFRLGGGYSLSHRLGESFLARCMPSGHATLRRSDGRPVGWITGLESGMLAFDRAGITFRLEYGRGDIVEHVAKWKEEGLLLTLGTVLRL